MSSVVRESVRESVRLVRKQIFSFFPRETFTCLRCVIKRSPLLAHYPMRAAYLGTAGGITLAETRVYLLR